MKTRARDLRAMAGGEWSGKMKMACLHSHCVGDSNDENLFVTNFLMVQNKYCAIYRHFCTHKLTFHLFMSPKDVSPILSLSLTFRAAPALSTIN